MGRKNKKKATESQAGPSKETSEHVGSEANKTVIDKTNMNILKEEKKTEQKTKTACKSNSKISGEIAKSEPGTSGEKRNSGAKVTNSLKIEPVSFKDEKPSEINVEDTGKSKPGTSEIKVKSDSNTFVGNKKSVTKVTNQCEPENSGGKKKSETRVRNSGQNEPAGKRKSVEKVTVSLKKEPESSKIVQQSKVTMKNEPGTSEQMVKKESGTSGGKRQIDIKVAHNLNGEIGTSGEKASTSKVKRKSVPENKIETKTKSAIPKKCEKEIQDEASSTNVIESKTEDKVADEKSHQENGIKESTENNKLFNLNSVHTPVEDRLHRIILFKSEAPIYCANTIEEDLTYDQIKHDKEVSANLIEDLEKMGTFTSITKPEKSIFRSVEHMILNGNRNDILKKLTQILDSQNSILINYDVVLCILIKCLDKVRQDINTTKPSTEISAFRQEVIELINKICQDNAKRFLIFFSYLVKVDKSLTRNSAVRKFLTKWYTSKEISKLLILFGQCSNYKQTHHKHVVRLIHLGPTELSPDFQLALFTIHNGFPLVASRLENGLFEEHIKIPDSLKNATFFDNASDEIKQIIKDFANIRNPLTHNAEVARIVKLYNLDDIKYHVDPSFHKIFKVNHAVMDVMSLSNLLLDMHRLRKYALLRTDPYTNFENRTTVDTFLFNLKKKPTTNIHPVQVFLAYYEYVIVPQRIQMFHKNNNTKDKDDESYTELSIRLPNPRIVAALNKLYVKSFSNMKKQDLNITLCIDFTPGVQNSFLYRNRMIKSDHFIMLLVDSIFKSVKNSRKLRIVSFSKKDFQPIIVLNKHDGIEAGDDESDDTDDAVVAEVEESDKGSDKKEGSDDEDASEEEELDEEKQKELQDNMLLNYKKYWTFYSEQVQNPDGITFHKLFSWSLKQKWQPDVFIAITTQKDISLFKSHVWFSEFVAKSRRRNGRLLTFSPTGHIKDSRVIHRKNMLHIVGINDKITHIMQDFLDKKIP